MTKIEKQMKVELKRARKQFKRNGSINSPVIYIRPADNPNKQFGIYVGWKSYAGKKAAMARLRELCEEAKPVEVMTVSDSWIHNDDENGIRTTSDALVVTAETPDRIRMAIQPYHRDANGKVVFGEEVWETHEEKNTDFNLEGLVQ